MPGMSSHVDLHVELRHVAAGFASAVGGGRSTDPGITPRNLSLVLPFYLIEGYPFDGDAAAAREMSLGNAFGAAHFLAQDRVLDGETTPSPKRAMFSDLCLERFVETYVRLSTECARPPEDDGRASGGDAKTSRGDPRASWGAGRSPGGSGRPAGNGARLRAALERYLREYFESLSWERGVLWGADGHAAVAGSELEGTLAMLGRKMSPLKICVAAVALLSGSDELARAGEEIVEAYHAGHQLLDDLADLSADAVRGHWSVPLWMAAQTGALGIPGSRSARGRSTQSQVSDVPSEGVEATVADAVSPAQLTQSELFEVMVDSGVYERVHRLAGQRYGEAQRIASELGLVSLARYLERTREAAERVSVRVGRRARVALADHGGPSGGSPATGAPAPAMRGDPPAVASDVHVFSVGGRRFVVDPVSGLFFEADDVAVDILEWIRAGASPAGRHALAMNHGADALAEALRELSLLGPLPPDASATQTLPPEPGTIVSLALNVTSRCNLACDYCYLGLGAQAPAVRSVGDCTMSEETALKAVDLLLDEAAPEGEAALIFFGGEPLLEAELISHVARAALARASDRGVRLSIHTTTNGTTLAPRVARRLHELGVSVMVSVDGPPAVHDRHRAHPDGSGSHADIARNLRRLPQGMSVSARVTVTPDSAGLVETVSHLRRLGFTAVHASPVSGGDLRPAFARALEAQLEELAEWELESLVRGAGPVVGNFARAMRALASGRPRSLPCGAGLRYLCAAPDGRLFVCHRFVGDGAMEVGGVDTGVDREAVRAILESLRTRAAVCRSCWARFLCGGPCLHDLHASAGRVDPERCRVTKRGLELAMWMYASLPESAKRGLLSAAEKTC